MQHTNNRTMGGTASRGMRDTIGYEEAASVDSGVTNSIVEYGVHQYAWYRSMDEYGGAAVTQVNNIWCMGYEDIYGHKWEMMDGVDVPNDSGNYGKWRIWMPDGSVRWVKATTNSDYWITAVAHGRYMDVIPVGNVVGSSSTYYGDKYWFSGSQSRVVYRGCYYAYAAGGVSYTYASNDASASHSNVGSRLANYQSVPRQGGMCPSIPHRGGQATAKALIRVESRNIKCRVESGRPTPRLEGLRPGERKAHAFR